MKKCIHIFNGPNLNLLGVREPAIYGTTTLSEIQSRCEKRAQEAGYSVSFFQSNHEGELVDLIQAARGNATAIVINAAGYSFYSVAILDALKTFDGSIIEVHLSNIHQRDKFHRHSIMSTVATGVICGLGPQGYISAINAVIAMSE
ncbi:MAG: type II 3-dehydroquinate dehydratase [Nitrospira sp.]|nr:type II 3-dehydroquinate dehydratase [Nitrospira sp.]MBX3513183.1 type II 3-dehydroquinate dehydratase [Xanthobacteraceae bacterium]MCW5675439.1 type II 3-dehydroquinate dehydratase [Xanthobacteraceae bacterium]